MDSERLRQLQAPLKARYKEHPAEAILTTHARGVVDQTTLTCAIVSGKPGVPAGPGRGVGGDGTHASPEAMLLEALVACTGVTLASVATAMSLVLRSATIDAEGDVDLRGTLGVSREIPVGITRVRLRLALDTDAPAEKQAKLLELTERYCVVLQTLSKSPAVEVRLDAGPPAA